MTNSEAIAVDQDPAGEQGVFVGGIKDSAEVWSKPLGYDFTTRAVALLNRSTNSSATLTCYWTNLAFQAGTAATVRDLWAHQDLGSFTNSFTATVPPYGSMLLKIVGTPLAPPALGTNFLSDLQPIYAYTGYGTIVPDKSIGGNTITLGGLSYAHGIGVNARSGLEYNLGGVCSRFQATLGVDNEEIGSGPGSVDFHVYADGAEIYSSGFMHTNSPPQTIDLDVTGVRRLTLGVGDADDGISYDHADWANALVIVTNETPQTPETPTGLVASPGNAITLTWNNTLAALSYNVKRATVSGGPYTAIGNLPITTFTDSNVVSGTTYYYVVSAVSSFGEGSNSMEVAADPCSPPPVPTDVTTMSTNSQIVVSWNASPNATSYTIARFAAGTPPAVVATAVSATNFTDTTVMGGATYYYLVAAANACNQSVYATFVPAVVSPEPPTGLNAAGGNAEVVLSWTAPLGATSYNVKRSTANGGPYSVIATGESGTSYLDFDVTNDTTYYYVVSAVNGSGESADSVQVAVTPEAPITAYWTNIITAMPQNWNVDANWTNSGAFPDNVGELAVINAAIAAPQTIDLNQTISLGTLEIGAPSASASYTIAANGGSLIFSDTNFSSITEVVSSKGDTIAAPVTITTNLVIINDSTNALILAGPLTSSGGQLTLGSGTLQVGDGTTNGSLGSVSVADNAALVFNRSDSVTMSGAISGSGTVAQTGAGVLKLSGTNTFSGGVTIQDGTLQAGNGGALGSTSGATVITNGGTLDVDGNNLGAEAVEVSGWGVSSNGAIISSGSSAQDNAFEHVTLAGDTAFGGTGNWLAAGNPGRWDIRGSGTTLSTGGKPYNLYKVGSNQVSIVGVNVDSALANIVIQQGMLGFEDGSTSMGNPADTLTVEAGGTLELYQSSAPRNSYTKQFVLYGGGETPCVTNWAGGGSTTISGQMTLNGACLIGINGTSLTNNCTIVGSGSLTKSGAEPLVLGGVNTYEGDTTVNGGSMVLKGNGSITDSTLITVASAATLDASQRSDGTLTVANGQALTGNGTVKGNAVVAAGATLVPGGALTTLTFNNNLTLNGGSMTVMEVNTSPVLTNAMAQVAGALTYGGTLVITNFSPNSFAAGDSFKLFSAASYLGVFTNISPASPGFGLAWNTDGLTNGIVSVVSSSAQSQIFNVKTFGAMGDGTNIDSPAINAAIAAAAAAGGGTVTFPAGTYLSLSIHLTNNVTLYLSNNATILAANTNQGNFDAAESNPYSTYQDYGHSHFHDSLIWGEGLTNVSIAGSGVISGNGNLTSGNPGAGQADKALTLVMCGNVSITGVTITSAGHFGILADACTNMLVANAQILNAYANQHRDSFNLVDSSDVIVSNCVIQGSDDAMVLKSDYALGRTIGGNDIHIMDCQILSTENNATQFGSETVGPFTDVTWSNLQLGAAGKAGIGITSQDGSVIDGVTYDNITMSNCACPIFIKLDYRTGYTPNPSVGSISNISINNVTAVNSFYYNRTNTSTLNGYFDTNTMAEIPIENIAFSNVNLSNPGGNLASAITNDPVENQDWQPQDFGKWPCYGWYIRYANTISYTNCQVHFVSNDDRPAVVADMAANLWFDGFSADVGQNNTNYDMGFLNATNFVVTAAIASINSPSPGAALRIYTNNTIFSPPPITNFAFEAVLLMYSTNGAVAAVQTDSNEPGGEWLELAATGVNQSIQYTLPEIPAGTYDLQMLYKPHFDRGELSFALDGSVLGTLDQYLSSSATQIYPTQDWGNVTFSTNGTHTIQLTVIGKNAASSGYLLSAAEFVFSLVQPPPPMLDGALAYSNGMVQLSGSGYPTLSFRVQASTNLASTNWPTIGTATAGANGALVFTDTNAINQPMEFYRLVTP